MGYNIYYQPLNGFDTVFDYTLNNDIQDGLIEYLDYALLDKGNYFNTELGELAPNGQDYSRLSLVQDPNYTDGQVWEGFRKNWVWQSGVQFSPAPLVGTDDAKPGVSGVYVGGSFHPTSSVGTYAHYIDHYYGRVIFDSPIPTGSIVQAEHSYKWINVVYANDLPWYKEIQLETTSPTSQFFEAKKGEWNIPAEARLQLPAIAIEVVPTRTFKGYQLGGGQFVKNDVIFHCIAEDEITRNKLLDIISYQSDKIMPLFNSNTLHASGDFPLDYRGVPVSGALQYPDIVKNHYGGKIRFTQMSIQEMVTIGSDIYGGIVRMTAEGIKTNI